MPNLFVLFIYQPFFNLLVGIYFLLQFLPLPHKDMGIAVIVFTVIFRFLWLPMTIAGSRSARENRQVTEAIRKAKAQYSDDPVKEKQVFRDLMRQNRRLVFFTSLDLGLQIVIALMLYRIFSTGLGGADFHLLYRFMPAIKGKFDLIFWAKYDLTHPNMTLNFVQSLLVFVAEFFSLAFSPFPTTRREVTMLFVLPFMFFFLFLFLPAGKKLFIITTLIFSIVYMILRQINFMLHNIQRKLTPANTI